MATPETTSETARDTEEVVAGLPVQLEAERRPTSSDDPVAAHAGAPRVPGEGAAAAAATEASLDDAGPRSAWQIRDFRVIAFGQAASAVGDAVTYTALPLLVLALTGSGTVMGIVTALETLPDLVVGLPAGALADRWNRRTMMLLADLGRAVLTALIPLSTLVGLPTIAVILVVVAPINVLRVLFLAAWTGAIPRLVGRSLIGPASSYMEAIFAIGFIVGPGIAGLLVTRIGGAATLAIDAASFLVSATALLFVRTPLRGERPTGDSHLLADIREGLRFVRDHRLLRTALAFWGATGILTAGLVPGLTYLIEHDRRLGPDVFGLVIASYSLGTLIGALVAARLSRGHLGRLLVGGALVVSAAIVGITLVDRPELMAPVAFAGGAANTLVLVAYITIRAAGTPDALLGRVGATTRMISVGLQPIGAATAGVLLDAIGGRTTLELMGLGLATAAVFAVLSPTLRSARASSL